MVLYWKIKLEKRPHWNTELTIKTWGREFTKISSWRDYEIYAQGEKIGIATSEWLLIDAKKHTIGRITDELINAYGKVQKSVFEEEFSGKLKEPQEKEKIYDYTAKRRDMDVNQHINNVNYLELAYDALPEEIGTDFENIEIYYKRQVKLGEEISFFYSQEEGTHTVTIKSPDEKTLHVILKFS